MSQRLLWGLLALATLVCAPARGKAQTDIIGYSHVIRMAESRRWVEFVARDCAAFQAILNHNMVTYFEKGKNKPADIESALQLFRKDFALQKYGLAMP